MKLSDIGYVETVVLLLNKEHKQDNYKRSIL